jgi:predicted  nucleic acid-binding Zn-ribbon protein
MASDTAGKVEDMLRELGKKIDHLIDEAKEAKDDIRDDLEDKIKDLKNKKEKIEVDINEYKDSEKWQETKEHFSNAMAEFRQAMEAMITSLKK